MGTSAQLGYVSILGVTSLGLDWRSEQIFSNNLGTPTDTIKDPYDKEGFFNKSALRQHFSTSLRHVLELRKWHFAAGIMSNGNNQYGHHFYWGTSITYIANSHWQIHAWVNNAFRLPTFTDLYYHSAAQQGNPDLNPEKTRNSEISVSGKYSQWQFRNAWFFRNGHQIIDWVRLPGETVWHSRNLSDIQSYGTDISIMYSFTNLFQGHIKAEYTALYITKKLGGYISLYASEYLKNQLKISFTHPIWKKLNASWLVQVNDRLGTYFNSSKKEETPYTPYLLTHVKLNWKAETFSAYVEVNNLLNTPYFDFGELPQPGRWIKLGITAYLF